MEKGDSIIHVRAHSLFLFSVFFLLLSSCDGADRVTAFISIGGNKEKIDDFCGSGTPRELMSNSATMSLHFHSTPVSKGARGFKARYAFVSSRIDFLPVSSFPPFSSPECVIIM